MTVTSQTNTTLEEIAEALLKRSSFCVCGHVNPDGDCIGSTLGLASALRAIGKDVVALIADDTSLDPTFDFMPGADALVNAPDFQGEYEVFVAVDAPNDDRLGEDACRLRDGAALTVTIDHHAAPKRMSELSYTDPDASATTLLIWQLAGHLGIDADDPRWRDIATCTYAGLLTDTGRFMFQNTDALSLRLASDMVMTGIDPGFISQRLFQDKTLASIKIDSLAVEHMQFIAEGRVVISWISLDDMDAVGADKNDTESAINVIRSVRGVEVACFLKQRDDCIRGSLRAKGETDVSQVARRFGGGGHKAAAGFTLHCSLEEAIRMMREALTGLMD